MLGFLQRIGKALMLPIATLPAAALLLRLGQPDLLNIPFIASAGNAIFANLPIIFAIGIAIGFAKDNNGAAGLAGAIGYFVLSAGVQALNKEVNLDALGGIVTGVIAGLLYNRFHTIKLPDWLAFFGGRRFVPIITSAAMIVLAFIFGFVWPSVQHAFALLGTWMYDLGAFGAALYGMLNRLLLPLGLHHVINTLIWFQFGDYHGAHGEITRFFKHDPSAGLFLSGYFPIMMFGLPAACLAMIAAAKPHKRKAVSGMLIGIAFTSFLTGVTEPIEYSFMFLSPLLYGIHALLTASSMAVSYLLGIHAGFGFSAGAIDFFLNFRIAQKPILLIVQGLIYGGIYFIVFYSLIKRLHLKTPGREDDDDTIENNQNGFKKITSDDKYAVIAAQFIQDLGGVSNITSVDNCTTRLRLTVQDSQLADEHALKKHGAHGVVKLNKKNIQVIVGTNVEFVADSMKNQLKSPFDLSQVSANLDIENKPSNVTLTTNLGHLAFSSPLKGNLLNLEEVPDQVFSQKMMGEGFAIDPKDGIVISPINGKVTSVFPTKHAIGLLSDDGLEILIHIGIDTVNLKGEGFTVYVKEGEYITKGDILITFNLDEIKDKVPSVITPIIFTNLPENKHITLEQTEEVDLKEIIQIM